MENRAQWSFHTLRTRLGLGSAHLSCRATWMLLDGPPKPRRPITSDLRQEPGALVAHAGICAGGSGVTRPPTATVKDSVRGNA